MRFVAGAIAVSVLAGCATTKGNDRHAQHAADQIRMVAVQREAMVQEAQAESATQVALVEALSRVAASNPDHAPAVTVALAVIGVRALMQRLKIVLFWRCKDKRMKHWNGRKPSRLLLVDWLVDWA